MDGPGFFSGWASVYNVVDLVGDVVAPGAFVNLPDFRDRGMVCWDHDRSRPVAIPLEVVDDGIGLRLRGQFHGTPDGQAARQIIAERKAAGRVPFGLSIGYLVKADKLLAGTRILTKLQLLEISFVALPANPAALVREVKLEPAGDRRFSELAALVERARFLGVAV